MTYDIIVVGGGPAGMTAALYAARAGKSVLLLEREMTGGQILQSQRIENYPALPETDGYTFAENLKAQILSCGVVIENRMATGLAEREGGYAVQTDAGDLQARALILATGLKHKQLNVSGEQALIGRGISFCATCDGIFFRKKEVAVVGGGNTAVQDALVLSEFCSKVYLIHRRNELRAERALTERMFSKENVIFIGETVIDRIVGETRLEALKLKNVTSGEYFDLPVAGLFEAIGYQPQNEPFRGMVELDADGYFVTDEHCATSLPGVFAAGDGRQKEVRQLTTATADGTVAALSAAAYLDA